MSVDEPGSAPGATDHGVRDSTLESLEREIGILLRRARRVVGQRAELVHPDLQPAAYLMLALLVEKGTMRPSVIAELVDLDKGAVSRQVQQLVDLGLVSKVADPEDGRASLLTPTAQGVRGMQEVVAHRRVLLRERLEEWDDRDLLDFVRRLGHYNAALESPA